MPITEKSDLGWQHVKPRRMTFLGRDLPSDVRNVPESVPHFAIFPLLVFSKIHSQCLEAISPSPPQISLLLKGCLRDTMYHLFPNKFFSVSILFHLFHLPGSLTPCPSTPRPPAKSVWTRNSSINEADF